MSDPKRTLTDLCERSVARHSERPLFGEKTAGGWQWTTYREFGRLVERSRKGLAAAGISSGDRVAIISDNCLAWPVCAYATYALGGVFVPMYRSQNPDEWQFILKDAGVRLVFAATEEILRGLIEARDDLPDLETIVLLDAPAEDSRSYESLLRGGDAFSSPTVRPDPDALAALIYTSGTTGKPKGVMLSHRNIVSNVEALCSVFPITADDRTLAFLPWAHAYGQTCEVHILMHQGGSAAINDAVPNLLENLAEVQPTLLLAVPRIFNRIYDKVTTQLSERPAFIQRLVKDAVATASRAHRGESVGLAESLRLKLVDRLVFSKVRARFGGRLRYAISGSAALGLEVAEFIDALGIVFYEGYGLTETSPIVSVNVPGARKIGSVGKPLPGVRVEIDRQADRGTAEGQGEIVVYGPNVMKGYYHRPDEQAAALTPDGGFRTGDLGYFDSDGYLFVSGRVKEQFKLENGKYVMPAPLEDKLSRSPYISNVMLHGANKPYPVALVVVDESALGDWAEHEGISVDDVDRDGRVRELIQKEIESFGESFRRFEKPRDFVLTTRELTVENGLLTPTLKIKRPAVASEFGERLESLYGQGRGGAQSARLSA